MNEPELHSVEQWPKPANTESSWLETRHGNIRCALWPCDATPRGTIVLAHGMSEHIEKYYHVASRLRERGFTVAMMEWRGHGLSAQLQDPGDYFQQFDSDFARFMQTKVLDILPKPYIGMGHSMGGCLVCYAIHDHPEWFKAAVLTAPMLGIGMAKNIPLFSVMATGLKMMPSVFRKLFSGSQPVCFTNDQKRFAAYCSLRKAHPALSASRDVIVWLHSALKRLETMHAPGWYQKVSAPLLIFSAEREDLVDNHEITNAVLQLPDAHTEQVKSARHEILMELDMVQEPFWSQLDRFLQEHAPRVIVRQVPAQIAHVKPSASQSPDSIQLKINRD